MEIRIPKGGAVYGENKKIGMAFLAAAVLLSFPAVKIRRNHRKNEKAKTEDREWEKAENARYRKISGACNLYAGPDERGK